MALKLNLDTDPLPGIGNVIMMHAGMLARMGKKPLIFTEHLGRVNGIINKELFEYTLENAEAHDIPLINLTALMNYRTVAAMHKVVDRSQWVELPHDIEIGVSFRLGDPKKDGKFTFMTPTGVQMMKTFIKANKGRVLVCSDSEEFSKNLREELGSDKVYTLPEGATGMNQWFALSQCRAVCHTVRRMNVANEITTTFAPTAAVYGGAELIGITNDGDVLTQNKYYW